MLSCRDPPHAGDRRYECAFSASTADCATVDVTTATLVSLWDTGRPDDAGYQRELPHVPVHDSMYENSWSNQLSPHLQRNKQLQDTLMQKEEELVRLQEENNKLKAFLNSSYVRSLEEMTKRLSDQRTSDLMQKKRTFDEELPNASWTLQTGEAKRTCRNLSLEFCSVDKEASEPSLDSWILETLGLQDEKTIEGNSSFENSEDLPSFGSPGSNKKLLFSGLSCSPAGLSEYNRTTDSTNSLSSDTSREYLTLDPSHLCTGTSMGSLENTQSTNVPTVDFSPPRAASTPIHSLNASYLSHGSSRWPGDSGPLFSTSNTTRSRMDLAFKMSLSSQNSVKTHTFPQGQAFTRRDLQGGWNFTWVPRQGS